MTDLWATERDLSLTVSDNGTGLADSPEYQIPPSLQRRARLSGARVRAGKSPDGGTQIELNLRTRRWGVRK
jgi:signal transduction histidine kinase